MRNGQTPARDAAAKRYSIGPTPAQHIASLLGPQPRTAAELMAVWELRDERYGSRKRHGILQPLRNDEVAAVIAARKADIERLPAAERALAWRALGRWQSGLRVA